MEDCIFCKIAKGEIPSEFVYETPNLVVIRDIHPQAPVHLLVLPKKHIASLAHTSEEDAALLGELLRAAARAAELSGIDKDGYRVVVNTGRHGAQSVPHLHLHVLGGVQLSERMR